MEWCVERGNSEKDSEFQMGFEPTTFWKKNLVLHAKHKTQKLGHSQN